MGQVYRGYFKVVEELGEVLQIMGKLGPYPQGLHPDGGEDLKIRLEQELADLQAALGYFIAKNDLQIDYRRSKYKRGLFEEWILTGIDDQKERP